MILWRISLCVLFMGTVIFGKALGVEHLRLEYLENPIGVEFESPRFSWWLTSQELDVFQTAYQVDIVANGKQVFSTGKIMSKQNHLVETAFKTEAKTRYYWKVSIWDNKGNTAQSHENYFETGLFGNWNGKWITAPWNENPKEQNPVQYYRHVFEAKQKIKKVRVYATAYGLYQISINGKKLGNRELAPGWTSYEDRLKYQTYEAEPLLESGKNCIAVQLAQGWVQGRIGLKSKPEIWQEKLALLFEMHIEYENGQTEIVVSNDSWKVEKGGIRIADLYDGEVFDQNFEPEGWQLSSFNNQNWSNAQNLERPFANIIADEMPAVKVIEEIKPVDYSEVAANLTIYDFVQNRSGKIEITIIVDKPCEVIIKHAEVLAKNGQFYTENLRGAKAQLVLKYNKPGIYTYSPNFTFMGFRYVQVSGILRAQIKNIKMLILSSNLEESGSFACGDIKVNTLFDNIINSQQSNFIDVPIDCPQRDEKLGWTGDAQVFAPTAAYNSMVAPLFKNWLKDLAACQYENGAVPWVVPDVFRFEKKPSAGWADAAIVIPWEMYQRYGDANFLKEQYASMKAWTDYMVSNAEDNLWFGDMHFGDWMNILSPTKPNSMKRTAETDYIAQVYFQNALNTLAKTAEILGFSSDQKYYSALFKKANEAFLQEFVTPSGRIGLANQTAYLLALHFNLLPQKLKEEAIKNLVYDIESCGHLTTGFLGTPILNPTLSKNGHSQLAYTLLFNENFPSWLYQINNGSSSMWERWDGITTQGTFQDPYVNSFNHYAYGAIGYWLYAHVAGIQLSMEKAEQKIIIAPEIDERLAYVKANYAGICGKISSQWRVTNNQLECALEIPANSRATFIIPKGFVFESLTGVDNQKEVPYNFTKAPQTLNLGSGVYVLILRKTTENSH